MDVELTIKGDLRGLHLEPKDILVIHIDRDLTEEDAERIKRGAQKFLADAGLHNPILLTSADVSVGTQD